MTDVERLVAFVLARIAEDEAAARAAETGPWRAGMGYDESEGYVEDSNGETLVYSEGTVDFATAAHIARHDPARVLAECAAKRRIVELHEPDAPWCRWSHSAEYTHADMGGLCETLRLLAQPHAGADGWDETWKV